MMPSMMRVNPFADLQEMTERINRLFGDLRRGEDDLMRRGSWVPPVDIYENGSHELVIKAELPNMQREDIALTVESGTLTLSGEKRLDQSIRDEQYHRVERSYGTFSRSFSLPPTVDAEKVNAEYKDGVLTIRLPMREEAKPRQIKINTN